MGFAGHMSNVAAKRSKRGIRLARYYSWDTQLRKAGELIAPALKALSAKGIEAGVELYAGSMRRAIQEYAAKGDVHLIVSRAGIGQKIAGLLTGNSSLFDLFKRPSFDPVLLIHPSTVT